jgi:hypothetical protein
MYEKAKLSDKDKLLVEIVVYKIILLQRALTVGNKKSISICIIAAFAVSRINALSAEAVLYEDQKEKSRKVDQDN